MVARLLWEQEVRGSSPRTPTSIVIYYIHAGVTQLVEFLPSKQAVAGSSPVSRSQIYIVSLQAGEKPPGGNQAVIRQARDDVFLCQNAYSDILPHLLHCNTRNLTQQFVALELFPRESFLSQQPDLKRTGLFFLEIISRRAPTWRGRCCMRQAVCIASREIVLCGVLTAPP